jgi:DNA repair protein SbcC/Rad50
VIPEQLEIEAFGPFVAKQTLDFAKAGARGLFLIHGPTGSGKSTILDAMTFALYGETSGNDRDGADLVSTLADGAEARVTLTFQHAGAHYRVTRTPRQTRRKVRGDGTREVAPTARTSAMSPFVLGRTGRGRRGAPARAGRGLGSAVRPACLAARQRWLPARM